MEAVILLIFISFLSAAQSMRGGATHLGDGKSRVRWKRVRL